MRNEGTELFERLTPPPGGAAAFRHRIRRARWRRRTGRAALAGAAAALIAAGVARWTAKRSLPLPAEPDLALIALGLQQPPAEPASVPPDMRQRMALQRVPLESDRVVFYYVAVLALEPAGPVDD